MFRPGGQRRGRTITEVWLVQTERENAGYPFSVENLEKTGSSEVIFTGEELGLRPRGPDESILLPRFLFTGRE